MTKALSPRLAIILLAAALLLYPLVLSGAFYRDVGVAFLLAAISASAWNIVGGYAGQVSVGHSMFFGLGAYTPLLFYSLWGLPPIAGMNQACTANPAGSLTVSSTGCDNVTEAR